MKTKANIFQAITGISLAILLVACAAKTEEAEKSTANEASSQDNKSYTLHADSISVSSPMPISSAAAVKTKADSSRKFIRTGEIKFKTPNVYRSTIAIEDAVVRNGGFVTYTRLNSFISHKNTTRISSDSLLEMTYYTTENEMTLRVPDYMLDTTLKLIALNIDFLDYRIIQARDMSLELLANTLKQKRLEKYNNRMERNIDARGKKLEQMDNSEEKILAKEEQADNSKLENLKIQDEIAFSTVTLTLYENEKIKKELISNSENIREFEPSFLSKLSESILLGWQILSSILLFLITVWPIIIIALVVVFIIKKYSKRASK